MKLALLEHLRSPADGSKLTLDGPNDGNRIVEGHLVDGAGNRFPIVGGVPLFAESLSDDPTFNFKWKLIGDSYGRDDATRTFRQDWYLERFGFGTRPRLLEFLAEKAFVLDAGTGSGVDAEVFAQSPATVIAIDLSANAAKATYRHLDHHPYVHVLQADLRHLPFADGFFDFVSCDQVLHHTPDTRESFGRLVRHLAADGHMALYVYSKKSPIREFTDDFIRHRATVMSAEECLELCRGITQLGKALTESNATVTVDEAIPLLGIGTGTQDVQRFVYWNIMKCFWNPDYDELTNIIVNFDWYHPKYAWRHTPDEVRAWHAEHGLEIQRLDVVPSGIATIGRRAAVTG